MDDTDFATNKVYLLLDNEDADASLADGVPVDDLVPDKPPTALPPHVPSGHLFDENADANSLVMQKWGVIVPQGDRGRELFGLIADLVALREKEQGMKVIPFEVTPDMDAAAANDWVVNVLGAIEKQDRPRYILILGDLSDVSAELQIALGTRYFVGRLAFANAEGYRAYVQKVIRHETTEPLATQAKALLYTVRHHFSNRLKDAIDDAEKKLISSVMSESSKRHNKRRIAAKFERTNDLEISTKEEFLEIARSIPVSSFFFSVSHGHGASSDRPEAEKRSMQGALCFDNRVRLTAEDVKSGPFLPGGFWFLFACYGAGTPKRSAYAHWLRMKSVTNNLPKAGESPYIAALPQAALANPEGPLAIVGHLDLAWSSSYDADAGFRNQAARFTDLIDIANKKAWRRIGPTFGDFVRDLVDVNTKVTNAYDAEAANGSPALDNKTRKCLWMLRQDLSAYILLGDPATYLPFSRNVPRPPSAESYNDAEES